MGVYATVGELLLPGGTVIDKGIVHDAAIFFMVVFDSDKVVGSELFES